MAVRRVVAAIDVVINGQRNLDRLAQAYVASERAINQAQRALHGFGTTTTSTHRGVQMLTGSMRNLTGGFGAFVGSIMRGREALEQQGRATRGLRDNIMTLTRSMLLFSVMLPLVQLPQRAIEAFSDFIRVGAEWQDQMRVTNGLLNLSEEQFKGYNTQVQQMAITNGVATASMRDLLQTAASSVSAIKPNAQALQEMGQAAYDAHIALELANQSARLARATGTDAKDATTSLIQVMATYGLEIEHVSAVSDSLFAITDVGTVRFQELEHTLPRVTAAMGPMIQRYDTAEEKMTVMNEAFAAFAAMTQTMPAEQAATSFANIFKDVSQMTGKQKDLVQGWEKIRRAQGLGEEMSLRPEVLLNQGPMGTLVQLRKVFDLQGAMVNQYVANQRRLGNQADENALRVTGQSQLMQAYFEDMRAVRGFQNVSVEQLERAQQAFEASRGGAVERGLGQRSKSFLDAQQRFGVAMTAIQTEMFKSIEQPLIAGIDPITNMFAQMLENADFKNGSLLVKIRVFANGLMDQFANYFRSGGREQIQTVGREIGTFIGNSITAFFSGGKDNVLVEAARAFGEAFVSGIGQTLPEMLGAVLRSSVTKAIAEMVAIRYITRALFPGNFGRALAVGGAAALELGPGAVEGVGGGVPGFALPAAGATVLAGAAGAALLRGGQKSLFGKGVGIPTRAGALTNISDIMAYISLMAKNRLNIGGPIGTTGPRYPTGPSPISGPGWPGFLKMAGMGGRVGGNALLAALMGIPNILSAENEREAWGAAGGTAGSVLGGIGGGLLGSGILSPVLGVAGAIGGGALGGAAGTGLYDLFHPATGAGAGTAEAPERLALAETFAFGVDQSHAIPLLTQIRDVLIRSGGGTVGGFSGAVGGATSTQQVTGRGLEQSFVNQIDTQQLTAQQAQAACGPAAAAFFAKAYGRNPTLKEAYALVSKIQGGDPASVGGTRGVATLGKSLEAMGIQSEVQQGPNIDWGRLAENAKAGIPGIVNIGPKGNFPGHYFQIGGYNPETGQFNVGPSGGVLKAGGNKEWMTAEEMMALGPKQGAVYGLGKTGAGATGAGNLTEADIAAIPTSAATGMGDAAAGGAVTINIQNMMNVEHMDGNTDVRSLMGQMADILRQLSTGGSIVGQGGQVA